MQQTAEHATQDNASRGLTIAEAAAQLGVSVDTIRRRVKRGELQAEQVQTERGPLWRVMLDGPPGVHSAPSTTVPSTPGMPSNPAVHAMQPERPELLKSLEMLERAQSDVVAKAEAAAMWQTRAELLALQVQQRDRELADVRDELRMLRAPEQAAQEATSQDRPFFGDSEGVAVESTQTPTTHRNGRPWWRLW